MDKSERARPSLYGFPYADDLALCATMAGEFNSGNLWKPFMERLTGILRVSYNDILESAAGRLKVDHFAFLVIAAENVTSYVYSRSSNDLPGDFRKTRPPTFFPSNTVASKASSVDPPLRDTLNDG